MTSTQMVSATWSAICALILTPVVVASDQNPWPTFHGPKRDNIVHETGLLKQWPKDGPRMLWRFKECGKGYACVTIAQGMLFTSGDFGDEEMVLALDLDGRLKWKTPHGKAWKGAQPGSRTTPTYSDGCVYHLGPHGNLSAFDAATGKQIWTIDVREKFDAPFRTWGYTENLLVDGDKVFCMPGGAKGRVVAFDKKTGKVLWANIVIEDRAAYSSPILAVHNGVKQLIALARSSVVGLDAETGKLLWSHAHESTCDQNVTSPIYDQGRVFVTSGHKAGARVFQLPVLEQRQPASGNAEQGQLAPGSVERRQAVSAPCKELWFGTQLDNCHGGVVLLDGYLYGSGCRMYNKGLLCVEFATGRVMYRAEEIGKVSLTYADGLLYCFDNDGAMLLVKPTPQSATIVSRFPIPKKDTEHTLTHPVICGGRLYLRHLNDLFAYDIQDRGVAVK